MFYFQGVPGSNCKLAYSMWLLYVLCYHDCGCRLGGIYGTSCSMVTTEAEVCRLGSTCNGIAEA